MPFIELVFQLVILAIALAIAFYGAMLSAGAFLFALGAALLLGWIPILMCATDIYMNIGDGIIGTAALISVWVYSLCSIGIIALMWLKPDPDGLPPAFKFVSIFYKFDTVDIAHAAMGKNSATFDGLGFIEAIKNKPTSIYKSLMEERQMKRAAEKMRSEAGRMREATELSKAAVELEQIKAREKVLKKYLKDKDDE